MNLLKLSFLFSSVFALAACSHQEKSRLYDIQEAFSTYQAEKTINPELSLSFGKYVAGNVLKQDVKTVQRITIEGKTEEEICQWVFLSAVKRLQERALEIGASKIANISSYNNHKEYKSISKYECHIEGNTGSVALKANLIQ